MDDTKTCPMCAETVKAQAHVCRYCRYAFGTIPSDERETREGSNSAVRDDPVVADNERAWCWVLVASGAAVTLGAFLPVASVDTYGGERITINVYGNGEFAFVLGAILTLVGVGALIRGTLSPRLNLLAAAAGGLALVIALYDFSTASDFVTSYSSDDLAFATSGAGPFVVLLGSIGSVVAAATLLRRRTSVGQQLHRRALFGWPWFTWAVIVFLAVVWGVLSIISYFWYG
jgi:hypothetical protein